MSKDIRDENVIGFLLGENSLDDCWYGGSPKNKPKYWWRKKLREQLERERVETRKEEQIKMGYMKPDGTVVRNGYGLFSKEASYNRDAFLIHHKNADNIVVHEETGAVKAEYHFIPVAQLKKER